MKTDLINLRKNKTTLQLLMIMTMTMTMKKTMTNTMSTVTDKCGRQLKTHQITDKYHQDYY